MNYKVCSKCFEKFPATEKYFRKNKNGKYNLRGDCRECELEYKRQYHLNNKEKERQYRLDNKEREKERGRKYRKNNAEKEKLRHKKYYDNNQDKIKKYIEDNREVRKIYERNYYLENKEKKYEYNKIYNAKNKDKINTRRNERRKNNIHVNLRDKISNRIRGAITKGFKKTSATKLLGCSIEQLKQHLESQFQIGMTWDNYGSEWHIDHFMPCAWFNLEETEEQKLCFHFSNLQPLWKNDNLSKSDSVLFCYTENFINVAG